MMDPQSKKQRSVWQRIRASISGGEAHHRSPQDQERIEAWEEKLHADRERSQTRHLKGHGEWYISTKIRTDCGQRNPADEALVRELMDRISAITSEAKYSDVVVGVDGPEDIWWAPSGDTAATES